jgi:hypothetical protein
MPQSRLDLPNWKTQSRRLLTALLYLVLSTRIFAQQETPSFELDVLPLLTKHGCNSGACHGAAAGRGQFFLSLWGSDPKSDYDQIVHAFQSRRIRHASPQESLIIAKPSGRIAHEGQVRFDPDSTTAIKLSNWIKAGTPYGEPIKVDAFRIEAHGIESAQANSNWTLRAFARINGSAWPIEVTDRTAWEFDPNGSVNWIEQHPPTVGLERPGRHLIAARFAGQVQTSVLIAPYPSEPHSEPQSPTSFVDVEIQKLLDQANVQAATLIDDLSWLRRVSLDLVGRIPTVDEIHTFEALDPMDRKPITLDRLLSSEDFSRYWTFQLARWLGFGPIAMDPEATKAFEKYLLQQVSDRRSWKTIAKELLLSTGDSHAIGPTNFARLAADPRVHAELISRVFLGARMQCANCHNHPLDVWTQDDYHGLSAILAGLDRGRHVQYVGGTQVTNVRTKEPAIPKIPGASYLEVQIDAQATERNLKKLSDWIFDQENPRFAKVMANRLWAMMMGRGLIEPVDDLRTTNPASHPELLERLVQTLVESDYQPASVLKAIALSDAYARRYPDLQRPGIDASFFAAHVRKPLAPEVLYDALCDALGTPKEQRAIQWLDPTTPSESLDILGRCSRPRACEPTSNLGPIQSSLSQQLHWINGPLVNQAIESPECFLHRELSRGTPNAELLELGFLRIQTKRPRAEEIQTWLEQIPKEPQERRAWFEDWVWSQLSSSRFLSN